MTIEVTGVNTWNKGAELMLVAIRERFLAQRPDTRLVVDPWFGSYAERASHGLWLRPVVRKPGRSKLALGLMPASFRRAAGLVTYDEIQAVLDASGFAFGDQHPPSRTIDFARDVEAAKAAGKSVILLPQALGPFEQEPVRDAFARIARAADRVYARDPVSLAHARKAAGDLPSLRLAPDFTNLVKPPGPGRSVSSGVAWVVPNERMIEKAPTQEKAEAYLPMMATCIHEIERAGLRPRVLIHGRDDARLIDGLTQAMGKSLDVVQEHNAVGIKARLREGHLVIASRFHALVSALSQAVPSIATSWSHKYEMLFRDYNCEHLVLPVPSDSARIRAAIEATTGAHREGLIENLKERGDALVTQSEAMWADVESVLAGGQ